MKVLLSFALLTLVSSTISVLHSQKVYASSYGFNSSNATAAFKAAMYAKADTVVIDRQSGPWYIEPTRLFDISNKVIIFEKGVVLQSKSGTYSSRNAKLLDLFRPKNIEIIGYGAEFRMNRNELPKNPSSSQGRHALTIQIGNNVTVKGLTIKNAMGDGIYIGGSGKNDSRSYSKDIFIEDIFVENSYRQGISLISVENFFAKNSRFIKSNGALPEAGLDIEPNHSFERIVNVNFKNCRFMDNNHAGIKLAILNLNGSSKPLSVNFTDCYLNNNHSPDNKYVATEIHLGASKDKSWPVKGNVTFERLMVENSQWGALYSRKGADSYFVTLKDCVFKDICKDPDATPIFFEVQDYYKTSPSLGGYKFENVVIDYKNTSSAITVFGHETLKGAANITGNVAIVHPSGDKKLNLRKVKETSNVNLKVTNYKTFPKPTLSIKATTPNAVESNRTIGVYTFTRTSESKSLPLALKYSYSGRVSTRHDMQYIGVHKIIPSGSDRAYLFVKPINDTYSEGVENFKVSLLSGTHYNVNSSQRSSTVYILDENSLAPVATDDFAKLKTGETSKSINVIENDNKGGQVDPDSLALIDPNDSSKHLQNYFDPSTGKWSVNRTNGTITFSPCGDHIPECDQKFTAEKASITYYIEDQTNLESTTASVTISKDDVVIPDPLPIAKDDNFLFTPGVPSELYILANDQSGDAIDHSTLKLIRDIPGGTEETEEIEIGNQGVWKIDYENDYVEFTPSADDVVLDNFKLKYSVKDFQGNTTYGYMIFSKKTIVIDKLPISYDDYGTIIPNESSEINVVENDIDGDEIIVSTLKIFNQKSETSEGVYVDNLIVDGLGEWKVDNTQGTISFLPYDLDTIDEEEVTIDYAIEDPQGNKSFATVHWLKNGTDVSSQIVAVDDADIFEPGKITNLDVLANDENIELADISSLRLLNEEGKEIDLLQYENATWSVDKKTGTIMFDPCGRENSECINSFTEEVAEVEYSIKDKNGIAVTAKITLERKNSPGTAEENYIYPNPNDGNFSIVMKEDVSDAIITITDLTGKTILKQQNLTGRSFEVNLVDDLAKGLYVANINTGGIINSVKFVIN